MLAQALCRFRFGASMGLSVDAGQLRLKVRREDHLNT
jgi:hypothetical protein